MLNVERALADNTPLRHQKKNRQSTLMIYKRGDTNGCLITNATEHFLSEKCTWKQKYLVLAFLQHTSYRKEPRA